MRTRGTVLVCASLVVLALILTTTIASADLGLVKTSTKTKGATTITWDSSFVDLNYSCGSDITMTVTWTVNAGAANYADFNLKRFTPKSKKDPAKGELLSVSRTGNSVTVTFKFNGLHLDRRRNVEIGNAHFKLYLWIDKDGDRTPETLAGYGVNVHVEDPQ